MPVSQNEDELFALPFYGESSFTMYNKAMFDEAGLEMPEQPTWEQIAEFACELHDPENNQYGIVLRGLPGWGQVMAPLTTVVNTYGGDWFRHGVDAAARVARMERGCHLLRHPDAGMRRSRRHRHRLHRGD